MPIQNFYVAPTSTPYNPLQQWKATSNTSAFVATPASVSAYSKPSYYPLLNKAFVWGEAGNVFKINLSNNTLSSIAAPFTGRPDVVVNTNNYVYIFYQSSVAAPRVYYNVYRFDPSAETFTTVASSITAYDSSYFSSIQSSVSYQWTANNNLTWWDGSDTIWMGHSWSQYNQSQSAMARYSISSNNFIAAKSAYSNPTKILPPNSQFGETSGVDVILGVAPITDAGPTTQDRVFVCYQSGHPSLYGEKMWDKFSVSGSLNAVAYRGSGISSVYFGGYFDNQTSGVNWASSVGYSYTRNNTQVYNSTQGQFSGCNFGAIDENNILYLSNDGSLIVFNLLSRNSYNTGVTASPSLQAGANGWGMFYEPRITGNKVFTFANQNTTVSYNGTTAARGIIYNVSTIASA